MLAVPVRGGIGATRPLVAEVRNEVGDYRNTVFAVLPEKLHAPIHFLSRLKLTAVEVSPRYPIPWGVVEKFGLLASKPENCSSLSP